MGIYNNSLLKEMTEQSDYNREAVLFTISLAASDLEGERSKPLTQYDGLNPPHMVYEKYLMLFKRPEDIITRVDGKPFLLREYSRPREGDFSYSANVRYVEGTFSVEDTSSSFVSVSTNTESGPATHVSLRVKSPQGFDGIIVCDGSSGNAGESRMRFQKSWAYKQYVLPCAYMKTFSFEFKGAGQRIRDIRVYR